MAPEVIRERGYSKAADVYSLGVVVWEILTQQEPYKGIPLHEVPVRVVAGMRPSIPGTIPNTLAEAIRTAWHPLPEKRPSAAHLRLVLAGTQVQDGMPLAAILSIPVNDDEVARCMERPDHARLSSCRLSMHGGQTPRRFASEDERRWLEEEHRRCSLGRSSCGNEHPRRLSLASRRVSNARSSLDDTQPVTMCSTQEECSDVSTADIKPRLSCSPSTSVVAATTSENVCTDVKDDVSDSVSQLA
jgi:serine/threonine protein kinase